VAADGRIDEWDVLDRLGALVDKSLVAVEAGHEPRSRLLESSRPFAPEKLREAGESERAMRNHAKAVLAVYERSRADEFVLPMKTRLESAACLISTMPTPRSTGPAVPRTVACTLPALAGAIASSRVSWAPCALGLRGLCLTS